MGEPSETLQTRPVGPVKKEEFRNRDVREFGVDYRLKASKLGGNKSAGTGGWQKRDSWLGT